MKGPPRRRAAPWIVAVLGTLSVLLLLARGAERDAGQEPRSPLEAPPFEVLPVEAQPVDASPVEAFPTIGEAPRHQRISPGATHTYDLAVETGDYLEVRVEQAGADVALILFGPGGEELARTDRPNGSRGREEVLVVATSAGRHRLEVRAARAGPGVSTVAAGEYSIELVARRPASEEDRRRAHAMALLDRGEALRLGRRWPEARAVLGSALEELEGLGDGRRAAEALDRLARTARAEGSLETALELERRVVAVFDPESDAGPRAGALALLGLFHFDLDQLDAAVDAWTEALALRRREADLEGQGRLLHNLGHAYQRLGQGQRALEAYEAALLIRRESGDLEERGETLHNLGALELELGEDERGRRHLEEAAALWERLGDELAGARTLDRLGLVELAAGDAGSAAGRFERALELRRAASGRSPREAATAVSLAHLGLARRHQGRKEEALSLEGRALELFVAAGDSMGEARARENLGHLERDLGRGEEALDQHRRALELYRGLRDPAGESAALAALALDHRALGRPEAALEAIADSLELFEARRDELDAGGLRRSFLASASDRYGLAVELLMERADAEPAGPWELEALAASERARARGLLEALAVPPREPPAESGGTSLAELESSLALGLSLAARRRTERLAAAPPDEAAIRRAELRVEELAHRLDDVRGKLARRRGRGGAAGEPLTAAELPRWVAPGEVLLEYHLGSAESYLWVLSREGDTPHLESYRLPPASVLEPLARRAHRLLARSHRREARGLFVQTLCELSRQLLAPVAERLGERRVVVAADGALHYLPFAALPDPRFEGPCAVAPPLVVHQPVVSSPSLSSRRAAALRSRRAPERGLAVLADPVFEALDPAFPRLPGTRREAERVAALAPGSTLMALGADARKEVLTGGALTSYRWLHLATHARVDDRRPELSALILAGEDGDLLLHEIAGLELRAELVTLSACRSALGQEVGGEALVGLAGAFLEAGAEQVLVSLWDVSDDSTAELMARFYAGLWLRGLPPDEALRQAQISLLGEAQRRAPYHWAGFVLYG